MDWKNKKLSWVGASLSKERITEFENEYRKRLEKYDTDLLKLKHQIHIEIYKSTKTF